MHKSLSSMYILNMYMCIEMQIYVFYLSVSVFLLAAIASRICEKM